MIDCTNNRYFENDLYIRLLVYLISGNMENIPIFWTYLPNVQTLIERSTNAPLAAIQFLQGMYFYINKRGIFGIWKKNIMDVFNTLFLCIQTDDMYWCNNNGKVARWFMHSANGSVQFRDYFSMFLLNVKPRQMLFGLKNSYQVWTSIWHVSFDNYYLQSINKTQLFLMNLSKS